MGVKRGYVHDKCTVKSLLKTSSLQYVYVRVVPCHFPDFHSVSVSVSVPVRVCILMQIVVMLNESQNCCTSRGLNEF